MMTLWRFVRCLLELVSNWNRTFRAESSFSLWQSHASGAPGHATSGHPQIFCSLPSANVTSLLLGTYSVPSLMWGALHMLFHLILRLPYEVNGAKWDSEMFVTPVTSPGCDSQNSNLGLPDSRGPCFFCCSSLPGTLLQSYSQNFD